jgi:[citrate (pro-3S)-lyase] ligase
METVYGSPFKGRTLEALKRFLGGCGLKYDERVEFSVCLGDDGRLAAAGSLDGAVLKCLAVAPERQGENLAAAVVSELVAEAFRRGRSHLFLYTKPENEALFSSLGFYPIAKTDFTLLMENKRDGVESFVEGIKERLSRGQDVTLESGVAGGIVANCNPFTLGHRFLIEQAAARCGRLYLFVVAENKSLFSALDRLAMVRMGVRDLGNVMVCSTGPYVVSAATFPDYFLKDGPGAPSPRQVNTELDLRIFAERFAGPLGISCRFVGTEPLDAVTAAYNRQMKELLPRYNIEVIEIPRLESAGNVVSASRVRALLKEGKLEEIKALVPETSYAWLRRQNKS